MSTLETFSKSSQEKAVEPVCRMTIEPGITRLSADYKQCKYCFCAEKCLKSFETNPEKYTNPKPAKKKGRFGRYLERMAKINKKEFGDNGPSCCHLG